MDTLKRIVLFKNTLYCLLVIALGTRIENIAVFALKETEVQWGIIWIIAKKIFIQNTVYLGEPTWLR